MNSKLMLLILGIGMMFLFVQCDDISSSNPPGENEEPQDDELSSPELISPVNDAENQSTTLEFNWKKINGAEEYHILVSESEDFSDVVVDSISKSTTIKTEDLSAETSYFWKVSPLKKDLTGPWSEVWQFTSSDENQEAVIVELKSPKTGAELSAEELVFEWEADADAATYHFQVSADDQFNTIEVDSVSKSDFIQVPSLKEGEYFWRVTPNLKSAPAEWSEPRSFTLTEDATSPSAMLISPSNGVEDQALSVTLEWKGNSGEEYDLQVATDTDFSDLVADETQEETTFKLEDLDSNQTYFWRISAGDDNWTDFWSFSTKAENGDDGGDTDDPEPPAPGDGNFVTAQNGDFVIDGEKYRFAGTNAYYLPNYEKLDTGVVDNALDVFEETGIDVVRMWAFYDGYDCGYSSSDRNENVIQTSPGEYSEEALRDLDRVIAKGKEKGIRFNLALLNYWDQLGGICQYNTWAGASNPARNMDFFMNNSETQKWFKDYISMLLNRVNTETGIAYKDEPAIFAWHIINEGRNTGADPQILRDWYQEMAQYIKSIDSNHMVATGEEGFDDGTPSQYTTGKYSNTYSLRANEGTSYVLNTAIPEIDYGTAHWYAPDYGFGSGVGQTMIDAQHAWVEDHSAIAESNNKPFVISEYGYPGWADSNVDVAYDDFWSLAEDIELDGSLIWQLTADHVKCYEFGGNICYPGGRNDTNLYNRFNTHVQNMKSSK